MSRGLLVKGAFSEASTFLYVLLQNSLHIGVYLHTFWIGVHLNCERPHFNVLALSAYSLFYYTAFTDVNASEILEREQKAAASRAFTDQSPPASEPSRPFFTDPEVRWQYLLKIET